MSTSLKKSTLNALKLIVTFDVSVAIAVAMLVPPNILSVDSPDAITCPSSLTMVLNVSPLPPPAAWSTKLKLPAPSVLNT